MNTFCRRASFFIVKANKFVVLSLRGTAIIPIARSTRYLHCTNVNYLPKIYTRTGDKGTTVLLTGERRSKDDMVFEVLGANDELSTIIGLASEFALEHGHSFVNQLESIQCRLQELNSSVATPMKTANVSQRKRVEFELSHVEMLEAWIDQLSAELPPLTNFILPSGGKTSCILHLARTRCRAAERRLATLVKERDADSIALKYLNRLSDYLFTLARFAAQNEGKPEKIYKRNVTVEP